jgi:hypothetical protein
MNPHAWLVVQHAAQMRKTHYATKGIQTLGWPSLTDEQKVPWIIAADAKLRAQEAA